MTAVALFDTLAFAKKLIAAGMPAIQAEAQAKAMFELIDDKLATKKDVDELRMEVKKDISDLRTELKRDMQEMSYKLTIRLGGMIVIAISILSAIIKL